MNLGRNSAVPDLQPDSQPWGGIKNISLLGRDHGIPPFAEKIMMKLNNALTGWPPFFHSDLGRVVFPPVTNGLSQLPAGTQQRVGIIGAGLGGLITALELAKLGYQVDIYEAQDHLGGRLGGKNDDHTPSGVWEHGLHHFFVNVYDFLMQKLAEVGADQYFAPVDSVYLNLEQNQDETLRISPNAHVLNLIGILWRSPNVKLWDALKSLPGMLPAFFYHHRRVIQKYDQLTMREYAQKTGIARSFYDIFINSVLSVSLNRMTETSAAHVLQLMWVFFLCRPNAMLRVVPTDNHYIAIWEPFQRHLQALGVQIHTEHVVESLEIDDRQVRAIRLQHGTKVNCDRLVLATDIRGAQNILRQTLDLEPVPQLKRITETIGKLKIAPPYIVARVYFLQQPNDLTLPDVIETPENQPLDLIFQPHKTEACEAHWVAQDPNRWILEVHAYDLGPALAPCFGLSEAEGQQLTDDQLWQQMQQLTDEQIWGVLQQYLAEVDGLENMAQAPVYPQGGLQLRRYYNFTGFQPGQGDRPPPFLAQPEIDNLFFVGDWVAIQSQDEAGQPSQVYPGGNLMGHTAAVAGITAGLIAAQDRVVGPAVTVV